MTPEDDSLQALHPLLCTRCAIGSKVVGAVSGLDFKVDPFSVLVGDASRDSIAKVDLSMGKVQIRGVTIVRKDVALQAEPVPVVLGIPPATLGKEAGLGNGVLNVLTHGPSAVQNKLTAFFGR